MKPIEWSQEKNERLKLKRGISFEQVAEKLEKGLIVDNFDHPNQIRYPNQKEFVIEIRNYFYLVPYVSDKEKIFLKTIIPSRKLTKKYGK